MVALFCREVMIKLLNCGISEQRWGLTCEYAYSTLTTFKKKSRRHVCIRFGITLELFRVLVIIRQALLLPLAQWIGKCLGNEHLSLYPLLPILTTQHYCQIQIYQIVRHQDPQANSALRRRAWSFYTVFSFGRQFRSFWRS